MHARTHARTNAGNSRRRCRGWPEGRGIYGRGRVDHHQRRRATGAKQSYKHTRPNTHTHTHTHTLPNKNGFVSFRIALGFRTPRWRMRWCSRCSRRMRAAARLSPLRCGRTNTPPIKLSTALSCHHHYPSGRRAGGLSVVASVWLPLLPLCVCATR
jgi:hypothetical protein